MYMSHLQQPTTDLCVGLNALGQQLQLNLEMSRRDNRRNLVIILFSHVLDLYQRALGSAERGQIAETRALLTEIIDAAFATAAVISKPDIAFDFFDTDDVQRIFHRKTRQALPRNVRDRIKTLSAPALSAQAGLAEYYKAVDQIAVRARSRDDLDALMIPACESLFLAARQVADFFAVHELDAEFREYMESYSALIARH